MSDSSEWTVGGEVGPVMIPRHARRSLTKGSMLRDKMETTADPVEQQRLELMAALEDRYAEARGQAQDVVQAHTLEHGFNPIQTAGDMIAESDRSRLYDAADEMYDRELAEINQLTGHTDADLLKRKRFNSIAARVAGF